MKNTQFETNPPIDFSYDYESKDESSDDDVNPNLRQLEAPSENTIYTERRLPSQFELAEAHAQKHVWSQEETQASVQISNSQPTSQRGGGRGQRDGRNQRDGRDQRDDRDRGSKNDKDEGNKDTVADVPSHMTSIIQF